MAIAQELGLDQQMPIPDIFDFCEGSLNEVLRNFTMVDPGNMTEYPYYGQGGIDIEWKLYEIEFNDPDDIFSFEYYMTNPLDSVFKMENDEIIWVESNTSGANADAFIYDNGMLSLNKSQQYVSEALNCNPAEESCSGGFLQDFALTRNGCEIAWVSVRWYYNFY